MQNIQQLIEEAWTATDFKIVMGDGTAMLIKSASLKLALTHAFVLHEAKVVKRCLWTGGLWYVYL